jgi:hypothetical protein
MDDEDENEAINEVASAKMLPQGGSSDKSADTEEVAVEINDEPSLSSEMVERVGAVFTSHCSSLQALSFPDVQPPRPRFRNFTRSIILKRLERLPLC